MISATTRGFLSSGLGRKRRDGEAIPESDRPADNRRVERPHRILMIPLRRDPTGDSNDRVKDMRKDLQTTAQREYVERCKFSQCQTGGFGLSEQMYCDVCLQTARR